MQIVYNQPDIQFELDIEDRVCVLYNKSGEGKSFLFKSLRNNMHKEFSDNYYYFDYSNYNSISENHPMFKNSKSLIVFDNADLYIKDYRELIKNSCAIFIIITKHIYDTVSGLTYTKYSITHTQNKVIISRRENAVNSI